MPSLSIRLFCLLKQRGLRILDAECLPHHPRVRVNLVLRISPESEAEQFRGPVNLEAERLAEISQRVAVERDLDRLVPVRHHDALCRVKAELRPEHAATKNQVCSLKPVHKQQM